MQIQNPSRSGVATHLAGFAAFGVLLAFAALLYGPAALRAELLNFDDPFYFGPDNAAFRDGGLAHILDPRATIANAYLPVAHLSLYLDYACGGAEHAWLPRLHSLGIHVLAAWVLARLLGRLGLTRIASVAAAAVFLAHPALVESVAWVSGRKDVLSGLFSFLCLSAVVRHAQSPGRGALVRVGVFGLLAVYAKATVVVLPLLAPLLVAVTPGRQPRAWRASTLVLVLVVGLGAVHHTALAASEGTLVGAADAGLRARALQVPGAFLHYLATVVWPRGLNVLYPEVLTLESFRAHFGVGLAALVGLGALSLLLARRPATRLASVALAALVVALLPFNTALPASAIAAADRYLYLVVPFAALAVVTLVGARLRAPLAVGLAALGAVGTLARLPAFDTSDSLWRASLAADPRNAVACINLALSPAVASDGAEVVRLYEAAAACARYPQHRLRAEGGLRDLAYAEGRLEAALRHAQGALAATADLPDDARARAVRVQASLRGAMIALAASDTAAADRLAAPALQLAPEHPAVVAYRWSLRLREALGSEGRLADPADPRGAEAVAALTQAAAATPDAYDPPLVRAQWLVAMGRALPALGAYDAAIRIDPHRLEAHLGKADLLLSEGLYPGAEAAIRDAVRAGVADINLYFKLGLALAGQGRLDDAKHYYEAYLQARPRDAQVRFLLGGVLATLTRRELHQLTPAQLEPRVERIRDLAPEHPLADFLLAVLRRQQRRHADALFLLQGVLPRLPDDPDAPRLLAETHRDLGYQLLMEGNDRARGVDHLRTFVRVAPASVSTDAARTLLDEEAKRLEAAGVAALQASQFGDAEAQLRRCLDLAPDREGAHFHLGLVLLQRGTDLAATHAIASCYAALAEFEAAERGVTARGGDASLAVFYRIVALVRLDRKDEAHAVARSYLADPNHTGAVAYERIEALLR